MTLAFTFPGMRGGFFHSGAALLPFFFPAAMVGLDASVDAAARILKHWRPEKSKPIFTLLLVVFAAGLTDVVFQQHVVGPDWLHPVRNQSDTVYAEVGQWLAAEAEPGAVVAVNNPPGFYYFTGHPSIVIPNGGPDILLRAARDFNARWVVLDLNVPDGLRELYAHPTSEPGLKLRHTFGGAIYIFQVEP